MDTLLRDVRYAGRTLWAHRTVTLLSVLCLALGMGVNSAIFSVVDAVLLRPLPFPDPDSLVLLREAPVREPDDEWPVSHATFRDWQAMSASYAALAGLVGRGVTLTGDGEPERYDAAFTSWNLFEVIGAQPALGRTFRPEEDAPHAGRVVILSDAVWKNRFAGDPRILGRAIVVNGQPHDVIGVMPPGFGFPDRQKLWIPLTQPGVSTARNNREVMVYGRLKPDVPLAGAREELNGITARIAAAYPAEYEGWRPVLKRTREELVDDDAEVAVLAMMGAVSFLLLIACANVANLLLARATQRGREMSVRLALGASRGRLLRQLLTESLLIAIVSVPLGVLVCSATLGLVDRGIDRADLPYFIHWSVDARVLLYTACMSIATGVIFGLAPAWQGSRAAVIDALKDRGAGAGTGRSRLRGALVVGEVALALVLLIGASLFARSFFNLLDASAGFDTRPLLTARFHMWKTDYTGPGAIHRRVQDVVQRLEALPGVEAVGASNLIPADGGGWRLPVLIEGQAAPDADRQSQVRCAGVTPGFFKALNLPPRRGRDFTTSEGQRRSSVAIINDAMAERFWPNEDAVGRRFQIVSEGIRDWFTVIGVTSHISNDEVPSTVRPSAYLPYPYMPTPNTGVMVRTASGDPTALAAHVRSAIHASDPDLPVFAVQSMEALRRQGFWEFQLFSWLFSGFGAVALLLATVGIYGVLSYTVSQRTREIGVRVALGAGRADVVRLMVRQGLRLTLGGVAIGVVGAFAVTHAVSSILYNVSPTDPVSFIALALFFAAVGLLAAYVPARRAARVDPVIALRSE